MKKSAEYRRLKAAAAKAPAEKMPADAHAGIMKWEPQADVPGGAEETAKKEAAENKSILPEWLLNIDSIDTESGVKHCGSEEDYIEVLKIFHQTKFLMLQLLMFFLLQFHLLAH